MVWIAPLLLVVPLVAALVLRVTPTGLHRRVGDALAVATAAVTTGLALVLLAAVRDGTQVNWVAGWGPVEGVAIGIPLVADPISAGMCVLAAALTTVALASKWGHFGTVDDRSHLLALVFLAGVCGFVLAGDVFTLFVFLELMSVCAYLLTGYRHSETGALQGAIVFGVTNTVGASLFLAGATVLYAHTGTPNLAEIAEVVAESGSQGPLVIAMTLLLVGLFAKAAIVPFHFWHADAHTVAPSWAAALFSGVLLQVAVYGLARVHWTAFAPVLEEHPAELRGLFVAFAVTTAVVASLFGFVQDDLKRLLAFSTLAHVGIATIGFATLEADGIAGAATYVVGHGLVKTGLFLVAGLLVLRYGTASISRLHGHLRSERFIALLLAVGGLALAGVPPFGLYTGKLLIEEGADAAGYDWLPYIMLAVAAVTGAAVLRAVAAMSLGLGTNRPVAAGGTIPTPHPHEDRSPEVGARVALPALLLLAVAAGTGPLQGFVDRAQEAGERFVEHGHYLDAVLGDESPVAEQPEPKPVFEAESLLEAAAAAGGTVALAAAGLRLTTRRPVTSRVRTAVSWLRGVHSGHIGDYLAWQMVGLAGLGATLTLLLR